MPVEDNLAVDPRDREHHLGFLASEEHGPRQVVAFHEVADRSFETHPALFEKHRPVGDRRRHIERLFDDDQRHPRRLQALHHPDELLDHDGGETQGQLVDHEDLGIVEHGDGQGQHLLLSARERVGSLARGGPSRPGTARDRSVRRRRSARSDR